MGDEPSSFAKMLFGLLARLETAFLGLTMIGIALKQTALPGANLTLMISLSGLAVVFFLMGYKPPAHNPGANDFTSLLYQTILPKIAWMGCSVMVTALLFTLLHLRGAQQMLIIGVGAGVISLAVAFAGLILNKENEPRLAGLLYRLVPITALSAYLLYLIY